MFCVLFSVFLAAAGGFFIGFVFMLITTGMTATIYILDKKMDYRLIIYIWVAIVTIVVMSYILIGVMKTAEIFRRPLKIV
jgi:biotin transporter BioY